MDVNDSPRVKTEKEVCFFISLKCTYCWFAVYVGVDKDISLYLTNTKLQLGLKKVIVCFL